MVSILILFQPSDLLNAGLDETRVALDVHACTEFLFGSADALFRGETLDART